MKNIKKDFEKKVNNIAEKIDLLTKFQIVYIKDSYNSLYVRQENGKYIIYVDIDEIYLKPLNIDALIIHELYHIKQYLNKFPMILSNDKKFHIIQKIITDLYVDIALNADGFYYYAKELFLYRVNNMEKLLKENLTVEDVYRICFLKFEAHNVFQNENIDIDKKILNIYDKRNECNIKIIYDIINKNYKNIFELYKELIKNEDNEKEVILFDEKIII